MNNDLNIVFLDASTIGQVEAIKKIEQLGHYTSYELTKPEERIDRIRGNQIVITNKVIIDKEIIDACPELKLICISATGTNNVDLEYAAHKGIIVKNVAGYSTESVAQTTFSMLLFLLNKLSYLDNYVKSGKYCNSLMFTHHGRSFREIKNKQFGIIGLGAIGKRVAEIAKVFGAQVVYYSTSGKNLSAGIPHLNFDELIETSDIISIHCPLNEATENLFSYQEFVKMKSEAILLNTGRGKIVNEKDLAKAIDDDQIAAVGLDVLEFEPMLKSNPLLHVKNKEKLLITPHIAWISKEAREELVEGIYNNIIHWISKTGK